MARNFENTSRKCASSSADRYVGLPLPPRWPGAGSASNLSATDFSSSLGLALDAAGDLGAGIGGGMGRPDAVGGGKAAGWSAAEPPVAWFSPKLNAELVRFSGAGPRISSRLALGF